MGQDGPNRMWELPPHSAACNVIPPTRTREQQGSKAEYEIEDFESISSGVDPGDASMNWNLEVESR